MNNTGPGSSPSGDWRKNAITSTEKSLGILSFVAYLFMRYSDDQAPGAIGDSHGR